MANRLHQRQVIHATLQALLLNKTAAQDRVYKTRLVPWKSVELPAISIYAGDEEVDPESRNTAPRELKRNCDFSFEAVVATSGDLDQELDDLALDIERALHVDPTFGGACSDSLLARTESGLKVEGNRPMGCTILTYTVRYFTYAPEDIDTVLDDLKTVDAKTSLGGVADPAEDTLVNLDQGS